MSDGTPWQSPDGAPAASSPPPPVPPATPPTPPVAPPAAPPVPRYGEYAPVTPVSTPQGAPGSNGAASGPGSAAGTPAGAPFSPASPYQRPIAGGPGATNQGWTPPPKPGLIPLQPMTLGAILAGSFQVMRRNPRPTFGVSLLINGIVAVVSLAAVGLSFYLGFDRLATASTSSIDDITAGSNALSLLSTFVSTALGLVGSAILQGIISLEVARAILGEKLTARQLLRLAKGRIAVLVGWSLLVGAVVLVVVGIVVAIIVALALSNTTAGIVGAVLLGLAAAAGGLVVGFWLATRLALVPSVLLIERAKLFPAMRRSWSLTTGYFWRTLGIQLLVNVIVATATQIIVVPITFALVIYTTVTNPTGDVAAMNDMLFATTVVTTIAAALIGSVTAIIVSATSSLLYVDLRMRKEGLDLTLVKFVEARQMGAGGSAGSGSAGEKGSLDDPYRVASANPDVNQAPNDSPWA